jgi:hypothetical protein
VRPIAHIIFAHHCHTFSRNGISFAFIEEAGIWSSIGSKIVPSFRRITNGDPFFAHAFAHSAPIGFSRPFV